MKNSNLQLGMSLVEILVSLVISLFLLAGIIQVFIADKASYTFTDSISRMQENGRFALDKMVEEIRLAGFTGCAIFDPLDTSNISNNLNQGHADYDDSIYDFIGGETIEGTDGNGNDPDSITIRGASTTQANIVPPYESDSADIHITPVNGLQIGDIVMLSNCRGADIFQITNMGPDDIQEYDNIVHNTGTGTPGNYNIDNCPDTGNAHCLSQTYGADSSVFKLQTVTYSIKEGGSGEPALWRSENGADVELIDGIENMQVLYGIDDNGDNYANQYVIASAVTNSLDVVSIRLMLLVRSASPNVTESPQVYNFNGVINITATDNRLRQVFSTSIALRNRAGI